MRNVCDVPISWCAWMRQVALLGLILLCGAMLAQAEDELVRMPDRADAASFVDALRWFDVPAPYYTLKHSVVFQQVVIDEMGREDVLALLEDADVERYYDSRILADAALAELLAEFDALERLLLAAQVVQEDHSEHVDGVDDPVEVIRETALFVGYIEDPIQLLATDSEALQYMLQLDEGATLDFLAFLERYDWLLGDPYDEEDLSALLPDLLIGLRDIDLRALTVRMILQEGYVSDLCADEGASCAPKKKKAISPNAGETPGSGKSGKTSKQKPLGKNKLKNAGPQSGKALKKMQGDGAKKHKLPGNNKKKSGGGGADVAEVPGGAKGVPTPQPNMGKVGSGGTKVKTGDKSVLKKSGEVTKSDGDNAGTSNDVVSMKNTSSNWTAQDVDTSDIVFETGGDGTAGSGSNEPVTVNDNDDPEAPNTGVATPDQNPNTGGVFDGPQGINPNMTYFTPKDFNPRINTGGNPLGGKSGMKHVVGEHDDDPTGQGHLINPGDKSPDKGPKQLNRGHKFKKTKKEQLTNPNPNLKKAKKKTSNKKKTTKKKKKKKKLP